MAAIDAVQLSPYARPAGCEIGNCDSGGAVSELPGANIHTKKQLRLIGLTGLVLMLLVKAGASATAAGNPPACPSQDLSTFLIAFAENVELQKSFTRFPYKYGYVDTDTEPEFTRRTRTVIPEQAKFPLIQNAAERKTHGLQILINVDDEQSLQARVTIVKEDTDWQVQYYFERTPFCWELVSIDDQSL